MIPGFKWEPTGQLQGMQFYCFVFNIVCYGYLISVKIKFSWISSVSYP